jgi:hypothetical protein
MITSRAFPSKDEFAAFSCCQQHLRMQEVPVILLLRAGPSRRASLLDSASDQQLAMLFFNLFLRSMNVFVAVQFALGRSGWKTRDQ